MNFTERNKTQDTFTDNEIVITFKKPVILQGYMNLQKTFTIKYDRKIIGENRSYLNEFVYDSLNGIYDNNVGDIRQGDRISENIEKIEIVITQ